MMVFITSKHYTIVWLTLLQIVKKRELQMKSPTPTLPATLPSVKPAMPQVPLPQAKPSPRDQPVQQSQHTESNIATTGSTQPGQVPATASINLPYRSEPQLSLGSASEARGQPVQYPSPPPREDIRTRSEPPLSNDVASSTYSVTSGGLQGSSQQAQADTGTVTVPVVKNGSSEAQGEPGIAELCVHFVSFYKARQKFQIVVSLCLSIFPCSLSRYKFSNAI